MMATMTASSRARSTSTVIASVLGRLVWVSWLVALLVAGCSDNTALRLIVRSDLSVPAEIDGLLINMRSSTGATAPQRSVALAVNAFPQSLVVRPESSGMSGTVTFTVQGVRAGTIVIQRVVNATFQSGRVVDVEVSLNNDCLGLECGPGIDCVRGVCANTMTDAGVADAGHGDAGSIDAGAVDAFQMADVSFVDDVTMPPDVAMPLDAPALDAFTPPDAFTPLDAFTPPDAFRPADAYVPPDTGVGCSGAACAGVVVISEFTHSGPSGGLDEMVEIHNTSARPADIGGAQIFYTSSSGTTRGSRATVPAGVRLPPGGYFLFAGSAYSGTPRADVATWTMGASDSGGSWSLENGGEVLDRVCWGTAVASICEGTALSAAQPSGGSYERKANASSTAASMSAGGADELAGNRYDTGNNSADFVLRAARNPQSSTSPPEP